MNLGMVNLKAKKGSSRRLKEVGDPFPNFTVQGHELPSICKCVFDGEKFYVDSERDMYILHRNGSFGVSSLTHRGPSLGNTSFLSRPYFLKQMERLESANLNGASTKLSSDCLSQTPFGCNKRAKIESSNALIPVLSVKNVTSNGHSNLVCGTVPSSEGQMDDSDNSCYAGSQTTRTRLVIDTSGDNEIVGPLEVLDQEKLILMPEEAIFLSFGVGCLVITSVRGETLGYRAVWKQLVELDPEFPISYAVYHYFRSKNWVPKLGDSYGASYVLYHVGPSVYHSTYIVHILGFPSRPTPTWTEVAAWLRLAGHVSKNVLLCEVSLPLTFNAVSSEPRSIFEMSLKETSLFRWVPTSSCSDNESPLNSTS